MKPATTIIKVCRVHEEFGSRPSTGVSNLARRTDLLPSDVHQTLTSLQYCGYIDQDPETKRYRLGCGLLKLGLIIDYEAKSIGNLRAPVRCGVTIRG